MTSSPQNKPPRSALLWDAGLAVGLVLAILVVFVVDRFRAVEAPAEAKAKVVTRTDDPAPVRRLRLSVTPDVAEFDDMGRLLTALGEGYRYDSLPLEDLTASEKTAETNVLFLTCSGVPQAWLDKRLRTGDRAGTEVFSPNRAMLDRVKECLVRFVSRGGTLYASDLHFEIVAHCFPEFVDVPKVNAGRVQSINAEVTDAGLRDAIGAKLPLKFDQPGWRPAAFKKDKVSVYLEGEYETQDGQRQQAPLLVKFQVKDGTVIFTSFHNEKQNNETELKLLRYLVFSAVTAGVQSRVAKTMGGFSRSKQNLFSASKGEEGVTQVYACTQAGLLKFVLGFEDQGARLKLTVTAPDGKVYQEEGTSTITIEIPDAAVGDWKYTVTPLKVPSDNFPFVVTVGEK